MSHPTIHPQDPQSPPGRNQEQVTLENDKTSNRINDSNNSNTYTSITPSASSQATGSSSGGRRRRSPLPILFPLMVILMLTSYMAGFHIGRSKDPNLMGKALDTITLVPDKKTVETKVHIAGRVVNADGTPYANGLVQLHSTPRETRTGDRGQFFFDNVEQGSHTLNLINEDGSVKAACQIQLSQQDDGAPARIEASGVGNYSLACSDAVQVVEMQVDLDGEEEGEISSLSINPDHFYYVTSDGLVGNREGTARREGKAAVLPGGTVVTADSTVILPVGKAVLPDKSVVDIPREGLTTEDGSVAKPDGTVITAEQTVIRPDGVIELPDGNTVFVDNGKIIHTDNNLLTVDEIQIENTYETSDNGTGNTGQNTENAGDSQTDPASAENPPGSLADGAGGANVNRQDEVPSQENGGIPGQPETTGPSGEGNAPSESSSGSLDNGSGNLDGGSGGTPNGNSNNSPSGNPGRPTAPDDDDDDDEEPDRPDNSGGSHEVTDGLKAEDYNSATESWVQLTAVDLFSNKTTGPEKAIAPGSSGYYLFRLSNNNSFPITYTLKLAEDLEKSFHLPIEYRLVWVQGEKDGQGVPQEGSTTPESLALEQMELDAGQTQIYRLEWIWPYEGADGWSDAKDTQVGTAANRRYLVNLTIQAQQRIP